jgi:CHAT domain-containing protein
MPAFLSWLDVLSAGVSADLVVLNACDLGDSGEAVNGNMSFAAAVSRAGARQVVAALWAVSDSAAALWVPAFYSAISAHPELDSAEGLRAAQLRLRSTISFRHPYFWAGMQSISNLNVAAAPGSPNRQVNIGAQ